MIEVQGKDGGVLQLEINYTSHEEYTFCYTNKNIFFICKDEDGDNKILWSFKRDLEKLLENNPNSSITEKLYQEPDSWLTTYLKKIFPSWSAKKTKPVRKDTGYGSCSFGFIYTGASLICRMVRDSSDYLLEFEFYDPYLTSNADEDEAMVLKGSLLVTEKALLTFYRGL